MPLRRLRVVALAALSVAASCAPGEPQQIAEVVSASGSAEVAELVNRARADRGLPRLARSPTLADAAVSQARYIAARGQLTHRSQGGATVKDRIEARGFDACLAAENLAAGQPGPSAVTSGWLSSPAHRSNMLLAQATHLGAGRAVTSDGMPYWVLVLARPC